MYANSLRITVGSQFMYLDFFFLTHLTCLSLINATKQKKKIISDF